MYTERDEVYARIAWSSVQSLFHSWVNVAGALGKPVRHGAALLYAYEALNHV